MKAHRNILFLSFFTGLVSLLFVITLAESTKGFQIALAFMGSSFISCLIEFPIFMSKRKENFNKLYYSLYDIKAGASILNFNINNNFNNNIITDKFYEQIIQNIKLYTNNLKSFDPDYYFLKKNNLIISNVINSVCNAFNNVNQSALKYTINYYNKKIKNNFNEGKDRNIMPNEMNDELRIILENSEFLINLINTYAAQIFSKAQYQFWLINDSVLANSNNNFKLMQK